MGGDGPLHISSSLRRAFEVFRGLGSDGCVARLTETGSTVGSFRPRSPFIGSGVGITRPRDPYAISEAIGYPRQDLMALVLADVVGVAEIGVAIFETGRDIVEELAFNTAADEPAIKIVLLADRNAADVPCQARPGVGIAAAHVEQIAIADDVAGAGRSIERIAGIERRIVGAVRPHPIAFAEREASF